MTGNAMITSKQNIVLLLVCLAGCSGNSDPKQKLLGTWLARPDQKTFQKDLGFAEKFAELDDDGNVDKAKLAAAKQKLHDKKEKGEKIVFGQDTVILDNDPLPYKVLAAEGDTVTITIEQGKVWLTIEIKFVGDDNATMSFGPDGSGLVLERVKE